MNKKTQVEFAPGCFDDFEGSQEELDQLQAELVEMFTNLTPEELEQRSQQVDLDALSQEDPDVAEKILGLLSDEPVRKLQ